MTSMDQSSLKADCERTGSRREVRIGKIDMSPVCYSREALSIKFWCEAIEDEDK